MDNTKIARELVAIAHEIVGKSQAEIVKGDDGKWYIVTDIYGKVPLSRYGIVIKGDKAQFYYLRHPKSRFEYDAEAAELGFRTPEITEYEYDSSENDFNRYFGSKALAKQAQKGGWSSTEIGIKEIDLKYIKPFPNARNAIFISNIGRYKEAPGKVIK